MNVVEYSGKPRTTLRATIRLKLSLASRWTTSTGAGSSRRKTAPPLGQTEDASMPGLAVKLACEGQAQIKRVRSVITKSTGGPDSMRSN